jgi:hypothetical protein
MGLPWEYVFRGESQVMPWSVTPFSGDTGRPEEVFA